MKSCTECLQPKKLDEFYFRKDRNTYRNECLTCQGLRMSLYRKDNKLNLKLLKTEKYLENKDQILSDKAIYYEDNKEKIKAQKKQYRIDNKLRLSSALIERRQCDLNFKLRLNLRSRLNKAIKNDQKIGSAVNDLGCSIDDLKIYLESKFEPGMTWDNYGKYGWHIDHIRPLISFDLTDFKQLREACCYTNLQPLWAEDNLSKSGRTNVRIL